MALFPASSGGSFGINLASTNKIHTISTVNDSWQATQNCWCVGSFGSGTSGSEATVTLSNGSNTQTFRSYAGTDSKAPICMPIQKGQTVSTRDRANQVYDLAFYGV